MRRDVGEDGLDFLQVTEHAVAENDVAVAGAAAALEAGLRAGRAQIHEFRRVGNRERLQQHLMEHRKDSSSRPDAECQGDDGDGRDERSSEKRADGERETAHHDVGRVNVLRRLAQPTVIAAGSFRPRSLPSNAKSCSRKAST